MNVKSKHTAPGSFVFMHVRNALKDMYKKPETYTTYVLYPNWTNPKNSV